MLLQQNALKVLLGGGNAFPGSRDTLLTAVMDSPTLGGGGGGGGGGEINKIKHVEVTSNNFVQLWW